MIATETRALRRGDIRTRYTEEDVAVLTEDERTRFLKPGTGDPHADVNLAWELLYRLEPELYDRLVAAERIHPGVIGWLPDDVERIVEVAAGTGRLTLELADRASEVIAIEPAAPLREILARKLAAGGRADRVRVTHGFFDDLALPDDCADMVVACSALTPAPAHGGAAGLAEMERVCRPGGRVVIVWPNDVRWLAEQGYLRVCFEGEMFVEFDSGEEAAELIEIFYPNAIEQSRRRGSRRVSFDALGTNAPRDLAYKVVA